ncbi:MFS transporter [Glutamicibacter uratoxydans]|uniref:MFS transporter n=1 Tax=Glutamicibacter uratoxydans TaxID=43667 RepID=UPI003D6DB8C2
MSLISELRMQPAVDSRASWDAPASMRLLLSAAVIFVLLCGANLATPLYPQLQSSLGLGTLGTTVAFASYVLALMLGLVSIGHWSDHIGRRAALVTAVLVGLLGTLVFAGAQGLVTLCVGRALQGLSVALATGASAAALRELLPTKPQWASRFTLLASSGGVAIGPVLGGALAMLPGGMRTAFFLQGAVLLALLIPLSVVRARPAIAPAAFGQRRNALAPRPGLVPAQANEDFWLAAGTGFLSFAVYGFILSLAPGHFAAVFDLRSPVLVGALAGLPLLASALSQLSAVRGRQLQAFATLSMALALGTLLIGVERAHLAVVLCALLVLGVGQGLTFRSAFAAAVDSVEISAHARTVSSIYLITYLGSALPVIGLGWAAGVFGMATGMRIFLSAAILLAVTLAVVAWLRQARTKENFRA